LTAESATGYVNRTLIGSGPITGTPLGVVLEELVIGLSSGAFSDTGYFDNLDVFTASGVPPSVPTLSTRGLALLGALLVGAAWNSISRWRTAGE
jgi:hypothetical protein